MGIICKNCGAENNQGVTYCLNCGQQLSQQGATTYSDMQNAYPSQEISLAGGAFVNPNEQIIATLSNNMANNLMSGEGFRDEEAVLTNMRLYYNRKDGLINQKKSEEKINIKDITGTKILNNNPRLLLVIAALILFIGILAAINNPWNGGYMFVQSLVYALIVVVVYLVRVKKHLRIEYAGGYIYFSVRKYGMENIRNFQKCIHAVKDMLEE